MLKCVKPSNLAALVWTSPQFEILRKDVFIQSAEGSLIFHASTATFGTYRCEAQEGGQQEVVISYDVRQIGSAQPRSPPLEVDHIPDASEEPDESILTTQPTTSVTTPVGDPTESRGAGSIVTKQNTNANDEEPKFKNTSPSDGLNSTDDPSWNERLNAPKRSYHSELVVVSLLLATCVLLLLLAGLHIRRQRQINPKLDGRSSAEGEGKVNRCMETVPSLGCPEDAPELKVE